MYDDFLLSNKYFRSFCIYRLIFGISYSLMIPILPLFFKHNGMSTVTIGIVISLYGVSKTIIQIPFGVISNIAGVISVPSLFIVNSSKLLKLSFFSSAYS